MWVARIAKLGARITGFEKLKIHPYRSTDSYRKEYRLYGGF
jgi:hypothetical protein